MAILSHDESDIKKMIFNGVELDSAYFDDDVAYEAWDGVVPLPSVVNPAVSVSKATGSTEQGTCYFKPKIDFYGYDNSNWGICSASMSGSAKTAVLDIKESSKDTIKIEGSWSTNHYAYVSEKGYSAAMSIKISDGTITRTVGSDSNTARTGTTSFSYAVNIAGMDKSKLHLLFGASWSMSYDLNAPGTWYFNGYVNISVGSIICS